MTTRSQGKEEESFFYQKVLSSTLFYLFWSVFIPTLRPESSRAHHHLCPLSSRAGRKHSVLLGSEPMFVVCGSGRCSFAFASTVDPDFPRRRGEEEAALVARRSRRGKGRGGAPRDDVEGGGEGGRGEGEDGWGLSGEGKGRGKEVDGRSVGRVGGGGGGGGPLARSASFSSLSSVLYILREEAPREKGRKKDTGRKDSYLPKIFAFLPALSLPSRNAI